MKQEKEEKSKEIKKELKVEETPALNLEIKEEPKPKELSLIKSNEPVKEKDETIVKYEPDAKLAMASKALPDYIKTPEQAAVIMKMGEELGIKRAIALNNIFPVNGKMTLPAPMMNALLIRGGVVWETLKDAEQIVDAKGTVTDIVTVIKFSRKNKDGLTLSEIGRFSWTEAATAGLMTKDVWKKYLRNMLWWRSFSNGAKRIASDLLNGMSETSEMIDSYEDAEFTYIIDNEDIKIIPKNRK